jgi:hypothetical protein
MLKFMFMCINPNPDGCKRCIAMRLGVIFDYQATNGKQGGLPVKAPSPGALILVAWESYITPSWPECTKTPTSTGGSTYILIEKSTRNTFFI